MADSNGRKKITSLELKARKGAGEKIVAVTAYDFTMARLVDELVDVVLVGDSVGMVIQGEPTTLTVTVDHMVYHSRAVARGLAKAHLVVDLPFMSYQASSRDALRNAGRILAEGNAQSVKMEGGTAIARTVEKIVTAGIPVMGHIGMTPQSFHAFGGFKVQGRGEKARHGILQDAVAIEEAGAYALVLESVPVDLAREITRRVKIPTIGIGAGRHCDGQVLVSTDLLGMNPDFAPRFVKRYADLAHTIRGAVAKYAGEVRDGSFPAEEHTFK